MIAITKDDLIIGRATGNAIGPEINNVLALLPDKRLRYDGVSIIDIADIEHYYIDDEGQKHIIEHDPSWQELDCNWDDSVILDDGVWRVKNEEDSLNDIKINKIASLVQSFKAELDSGFESSALGSTHRYDSESHNRENLIGAVAANQEVMYTCDDLQGNPDSKQQRLHTKDQIKEVLQAGVVVKQTLITKLRDLRTQVIVAADEATVSIIDW